MAENDLHLADSESILRIKNGIVKAKKRKSGPKWFKGMRAGFSALPSLGMTVSDYRVLCKMLGHVKYGSLVMVDQSEYAKLLDVSRETVCRSLNKLLEFRIISKTESIGQIHVYKVNPAYCWTGLDVSKTG